MKKSFAAVLLGALMLLFPIELAWASWEAVPLEERIEDADLVVLGRLVDVKPKYFSIRHNIHEYHQNLKDYTDVYDVGSIRIDKILKGSWHEGQVGFAFDHADQPKNPFRHMKIFFEENQYGIWILHRGTAGYFSVRRPDNFLPEESLEEVLAAVESLRAETGAAPKIIVEKRAKTEGDDYVAYFEGRTGERSMGRNKREAVGGLVLHNRHPGLILEIEVIESQEAVAE